MKIALIQMPVVKDKEANLSAAEAYVAKAKEQGAEIAVLPEMFFCPYSNEYFPLYAEERGGPSYQRIADMARKNGLTLVGGSMPERDGEKIYNTSFVFDAAGTEIARHRKAHLFDIDIKGGQRFFESDVFTPGDDITLFEANGHTFGLAICFDIRFPELFRCMSLKGAEAIFVPGAFNMSTGPLHWELSFRARALDNQLFTIGTAPARDVNGCYVSYANSIVCNPWGQVVVRAGADAELLLADIDLELNSSVRQQLPLLSARRPELYLK